MQLNYLGHTATVMSALNDLAKVVRTWSMLDKPKVKPVLTPWGKYWRVTIEEEQLIDDKVTYHGGSDLDKHCNWTAKQLESWPDVSRQSWQDWRFMHKADAEKFITLHTLVWAQ